jgi:hypothetical protein
MTLPAHGMNGESGTTSGASRSSRLRVIARHSLFCIAILLLYLVLNRPEVIMVSQLGFTVWYPATGLILAMMLGISPWYMLLAIFAGMLAGTLIYHQPVWSWSELAGSILESGSYALAASILRGPLRIDPALRQQRDVVRYISVTLVAAVFATISGVACLLADHTITWNQSWQSAWGWYVGDVVGLVGFAPFLLIHLLPWARRLLSSTGAKSERKSG